MLVSPEPVKRGTLLEHLDLALSVIAPETDAPPPPTLDERVHSRACGIHAHAHGPACHPNCPTCGGKPL
jgi:hypothetical protein